MDMDLLAQWVDKVSGFVWNNLLLYLLVATGVLFTIRTRIDLIGIAKEVEQRVASIRGKKLKIAVMGCAVNGPGEAREADLGIAGGDGVGLIFRRGEILRKVPQERLVDELMQEIEKYEC